MITNTRPAVCPRCRCTLPPGAGLPLELPAWFPCGAGRRYLCANNCHPFVAAWVASVEAAPLAPIDAYIDGLPNEPVPSARGANDDSHPAARVLARRLVIESGLAAQVTAQALACELETWRPSNYDQFTKLCDWTRRHLAARLSQVITNYC